MTDTPAVQLVVSHLDGQTCYYPANAGWRVDPRDRCLVIGRGLPRKHIPLDTVASFDIETVGAEVSAEPYAALIAELARLDTLAAERIAERPSGDLAAWYARGVRGAVRSMRVALDLAKPADPTGLTVPCDGTCGSDDVHDSHLADGALERLAAEDPAREPGTVTGCACIDAKQTDGLDRASDKLLADDREAIKPRATGGPIVITSQPGPNPAGLAQAVAAELADTQRRRPGYSHGAA